MHIKRFESVLPVTKKPEEKQKRNGTICWDWYNKKKRKITILLQKKFNQNLKNDSEKCLNQTLNYASEMQNIRTLILSPCFSAYIDSWDLYHVSQSYFDLLKLSLGMNSKITHIQLNKLEKMRKAHMEMLLGMICVTMSSKSYALSAGKKVSIIFLIDLNRKVEAYIVLAMKVKTHKSN